MENNTLELSLMDAEERELVEYIYNAIPAEDRGALNADDILFVLDEMDNYLDAAALAGRSVGISVFPRTGYILNSSIVRKEIEGVSSSIEYYFVWRKGHMLSVIEENFIDYIQAIVTKK